MKTLSTHILIADDDRALAQAVSWYLEAERFRVTLVEDGALTLESEDGKGTSVTMTLPAMEG